MPPLSHTSLRHLSTLSPHAQAHARQLIQMHPLIQVSSALRSVTWNKRVGGSPTSFHLQGRAVDLVGPLLDLQRAAEQAWRLRIGARCTGPEEVLLEDTGEPGQHLHVAW